MRAVFRLAVSGVLLCLLMAAGGCETRLPRFARPPGGIDAGLDAGLGAGRDAGLDAGRDDAGTTDASD